MRTLLIVTIFVFCCAISAAGRFEDRAPKNAIAKQPPISEDVQLVVQQLLDRVDQLETRDHTHQQLIKDLETRDHTHQQLIKDLEDRVKQLKTRDNDQQLLIQDLQGQLKAQQRPTVPSGDDITRQEVERMKGIADAGNIQSRIRRGEGEETIGFFATLSAHLTHAGDHQTFVFDRVVTNIGNGYNSHNGNFIAPVSGTYVFSATLLSLYQQSSHSQFTKNGQPISYMYVSGYEAGYDTTSQTIVVFMQKGDDISIQNINADKSYHGGHHCSFCGFLLQQNFSAPSVVGKK